MPFQRAYMGRMFLAPRSRALHTREAELWINVGLVFQGAQLTPRYDSRMDAACTKEQFEDLMHKVDKTLKANALPAYAMASPIFGWIAMIMGPFLIWHAETMVPPWEPTRKLLQPVVGCLLTLAGICAFCFVMVWQRRMNSKISSLIAGANWPSSVRSEMIYQSYTTPEVPDEMAVDQYGKLLVVAGAKNGGMYSMWPPLGYNIVVSVPKGDEFRELWCAEPAALPQGGQHAAEVQLQPEDGGLEASATE
eukprot:TRINITY_DN36942_c0_g2_i1.p1 TRINITY_DN36942_c0_g2~~TRINITY_DN36942_c0_g2_i1.p1  ORF type:complete len:250 (-),score=5.89 TRINITY_DN36942_c0_g2_i1:344-1093(-)